MSEDLKQPFLYFRVKTNTHDVEINLGSAFARVIIIGILAGAAIVRVLLIGGLK